MATGIENFLSGSQAIAFEVLIHSLSMAPARFLTGWYLVGKTAPIFMLDGNAIFASLPQKILRLSLCFANDQLRIR